MHYDYEKKPEYLEIIYACTGRKNKKKVWIQNQDLFFLLQGNSNHWAPVQPQIIYLNIIKSILLDRLKLFYMFSMLILVIK